MGPIPRCPARTDRSSRGASPHALSSCHLRSGVNGAETPATPVAPETAQKEAGERLEQLPWPRMILDGHLVKDGDLERAWWQPATADGREVLAGVAVFGWQPSDGARFELWDRGDPGDKLTLDDEDLDTKVRAALNVEGVHELWRDADPQPRHPLAPLVRAWWKRPVEVEDPRNDRPDPLFPAPLVHVQCNDRRAGNLFSPAVWTATQESGQFDLFPGFGPGEATSSSTRGGGFTCTVRARRCATTSSATTPTTASAPKGQGPFSVETVTGSGECVSPSSGAV